VRWTRVRRGDEVEVRQRLGSEEVEVRQRLGGEVEVQQL
jgi:hypothetical protein